MAFIILPHRWRIQPSWRPQINSGNPLTRGLTFAFTGNSLGFCLAGSGVQLKPAGAAALTASPNTQGLTFNDAASASGWVWESGSGVLSTANPRLGSTEASSLWFGTPGRIGPGGNPRLFDISPSFGSSPYCTCGFYALSANQLMAGWHNTGGFTNAGPYAPPTDGRPFPAVMTVNGSSGEIRGAVGYSPPFQIYTGANAFTWTAPNIVAGGWDGGANSGGFYMQLGVWWNRSLSDGEMEALAENPWQVFAPIQRRIYFTTAGGTDVSVNVTGNALTITRGTLAATGDANVSPSGKSATITAGTAAVAGDANVSVTGKLLTITAGTAAVSTGTDVNVSVTGVSAAVSRGTLAATGDANVSPTGVSATISSGTVTVTGDANVSVTGRALAASVGTADVSTAGIDVSVSVTGLAMAAQVGTVSFGPEVTTEAVVVTGGTGFGGARRPRTINEYLVRIGDKDYYFQTMEEAIAFIEAQRVALKPKVEEEAEKTARRILRQRGKARQAPVRKPTLVKVEAPPGERVEALNLELQRFERDFDLAIEAVLAREAEIEDVLWIAKHLGKL